MIQRGTSDAAHSVPAGGESPPGKSVLCRPRQDAAILQAKQEAVVKIPAATFFHCLGETDHHTDRIRDAGRFKPSQQ